MITRTRIPEIGTLDALIKSYIESKFQLSRVLPFASHNRINSHLPKFANKNKGTARSREIPINISFQCEVIVKLESVISLTDLQEFHALFVNFVCVRFLFFSCQLLRQALF